MNYVTNGSLAALQIIVYDVILSAASRRQYVKELVFKIYL